MTWSDASLCGSPALGAMGRGLRKPIAAGAPLLQKWIFGVVQSCAYFSTNSRLSTLPLSVIGISLTSVITEGRL